MKVKLTVKELENMTSIGDPARLQVGRSLFLDVVSPELAIWLYHERSLNRHKTIEIGRFGQQDNMATSLKNAIQNVQECKKGKISQFIRNTEIIPTILSIENIEDIFLACANTPKLIPEEVKIGLILMLVLGIKQLDLLCAKWEDVCFDSKLFYLKFETSSLSNFYSIPIPEDLLPLFEKLKDLSNGSNYLFPNEKSNHISTAKFRHYITRLFGFKNVPEFTTYDLRRTCVALMAQENISEMVIANCLNNSPRLTVKTFIKHDYMEERREAHDKLALLILPLTQFTNHVEKSS